MMSVASRVRQGLATLNLELPEKSLPRARFLPYRFCGDFLFMAGQTCDWNGEPRFKGKVGKDIDLEKGQKAAQLCGLNLLFHLLAASEAHAFSDVQCVRLGGFVNAEPDYPDVPLVVDGASKLFIDVLGERDGAHARTAVGVATLPRLAAVEVEAVFFVSRRETV